MRVEYKVNDKFTVRTTECDNTKSIFKELALLQKTFDEECCGKCKGTHLTFIHRTSGDYEFYELKCEDCYAKLEFGQAKDGASSLYPKRMVVDDKGKAVKDDEGKGSYLPDDGWLKYNKLTGEME